VSAALTILVGRDFISERESITFFTAFKACARVILPVFSRPLMILVSIFRFAMKHFYHDAAILSTAANQLNSRAGFEPRSRPKGMLAPFGNPLCPPQEAGFT